MNTEAQRYELRDMTCRVIGTFAAFTAAKDAARFHVASYVMDTETGECVLDNANLLKVSPR